MTWIVAILGVAIVGGVIYCYLVLTAPMDLTEFREMFPGRCPICSFHEYGWKNGYEQSRTPRPHKCLEHNYSTWPVQGVRVTKGK